MYIRTQQIANRCTMFNKFNIQQNGLCTSHATYCSQVEIQYG